MAYKEQQSLWGRPKGGAVSSKRLKLPLMEQAHVSNRDEAAGYVAGL